MLKATLGFLPLKGPSWAPPWPIHSVRLDCPPGAEVQAGLFLAGHLDSVRHKDCWVGGGWLMRALHLEQWVRTAAYSWVSTACLAGHLPVLLGPAAHQKLSQPWEDPRQARALKGSRTQVSSRWAVTSVVCVVWGQRLAAPT